MIADTYPAKRYPANPLTPQGARHLLEGRHPVIRLRAPDDSVVFDLFGGSSIPDWALAPECVQLKEPPKGVIASWKTIDQSGANQDGTTFLDAVNEAGEVELTLIVHARNGFELRAVLRTLFASLDSKRTSTLSWWTPEAGYWYSPVRWYRPPREGVVISGDECTAEITVTVRIDSGFWRGLDDVAQFRFAYDEMRDDFEVDYTEGAGPNWPIRYFGNGGGYVFAGKGQLRWRDDPNRRIGTEGRTFVMGPYDDGEFSETESDYQVLEFQLGKMLEFGAADDGWVRMGRDSDGDWNGYGTRVRVTGGSIRLSAFNNYHKTPVATWPIFPPPLPGEFIRVEAGDPDANDGEGDPRIFRVKRGWFKASITAFKTRDDAGITPLGEQFRGGGVGGHASPAWITQGTPASLTFVSFGDASVVTQSGYIPRLNIGEPRWDRYTLYGPGTFEIAAGPGSTQMVKFGPLLPNQIVRLNSDGTGPRIFDATRVPATPEELERYKDLLDDLKGLAPLGHDEAALQANASAYGVVPPQGNLHQLLEGWFTRPIPGKSAGLPAQEVNVAVSISGGNSQSRIIAHGTPLRRWPQ